MTADVQEDKMSSQLGVPCTPSYSVVRRRQYDNNDVQEDQRSSQLGVLCTPSYDDDEVNSMDNRSALIKMYDTMMLNKDRTEFQEMFKKLEEACDDDERMSKITIVRTCLVVLRERRDCYFGVSIVERTLRKLRKGRQVRFSTPPPPLRRRALEPPPAPKARMGQTSVRGLPDCGHG